MAENTNIQQTASFTLPRTTKQQQQQLTQSHQNESSTQKYFKRKLEKLKSKIAEFFFLKKTEPQNNKLMTTTTTTTNNPVIMCNSTSISKRNNSSNNLVLSQFYYGYKTTINDTSIEMSLNRNKLTQIESINEFIEPDLVDDDELQENLFDKNFMIDYISTQIICNLKKSYLLQSLSLDLRLPIDFNLLNEIAYDIYTQSENEPCGLKGCKLTIEIAINESLNKQIEKFEYQQLQQQQQQQQRFNYQYYQLPLTRTLTSFRFDTSSTLSTFELRLILKEDLDSLNWLRRILPKTKLFDKLRIQNAIYLGSSYDLVKRKLY